MVFAKEILRQPSIDRDMGLVITLMQINNEKEQRRKGEKEQKEEATEQSLLLWLCSPYLNQVC